MIHSELGLKKMRLRIEGLPWVWNLTWGSCSLMPQADMEMQAMTVMMVV